MKLHTYSVFHNYQVHRIFSLFPLTCSQIRCSQIRCSLKARNL
ncbi:hypothetical protein [Moorena producens]